MFRNMVLLTACLLTTACSGGNGPVSSAVTPSVTVEQPVEPVSEQRGFSEADLNNQPDQRISAGETAVVFLEQAGQGTSGADTGTDGVDTIPLRLREDSVLELSLDDRVQTAVVRDAQGSALLQADTAHPIARANLLAGDYSLELTAVSGPEGRLEFVSWTLQDAINRITVRKDDPDGDLTGIDLSGANLENADLSGANFSHSNLSNVFLFQCDLARINVSASRLTNVECTLCSLTDADFRDSMVQNLALNVSQADRARFDRCQGGSLTLFDCDLSRTSYRDADLSLLIGTASRTQFRPCPTGPPDFSGANLHPLKFSLPDALQDANQGVELPGAIFTGAKLPNADFARGAILDRANFLGADLTGANLFFASLSEAIWVDGRVLPEGQRGIPTF